MHDFTYLTAFTIGLMGGVHCIGMCGGIVGALSMSTQPGENHRAGMLKILLAYNTGRLFSYTLAGGLMGGIGWLASHWLAINALQIGLQLTAGLFMLLLGLYLSGWWPVLVHVEKLGSHLWRHIEPLSRGLLPVRNPGQALLLGILWGWLPCGLVYSVLIWSVSAGSFQHGALLMLSFGLGTLPNLLAMGVFAASMSQWVRQRHVRQIAGAMVMLFGIWNLVLAIRGVQ